MRGRWVISVSSELQRFAGIDMDREHNQLRRGEWFLRGGRRESVKVRGDKEETLGRVPDGSRRLRGER